MYPQKARILLGEWLKNKGMDEGVTYEILLQKVLQFNNTYYNQEFGLTMDEPLFALLADLFMSNLEMKVC